MLCGGQFFPKGVVPMFRGAVARRYLRWLSVIIVVCALGMPMACARQVRGQVGQICPVGTTVSIMLCIAPAYAGDSAGIPIKLANKKTLTNLGPKAGWIAEQIGTVGIDRLIGVTNKWINDHSGWGLFRFHWGPNPSLCLGFVTQESAKVALTSDCTLYSWVWKPTGERMFSFRYGELANQPNPFEPLCLTAGQTGAHLQRGVTIRILPVKPDDKHQYFELRLP
jgi:hypothetical protein